MLREDFSDLDSLGPARVARFLVGEHDDVIQAEVAAYVAQLITSVGKGT